MALEIERKFFVNDLNECIVQSTQSFEVTQGYLSTDPDKTVRVGYKHGRSSGFLTVKGRLQGFTRTEYEYVIPVQDAIAMVAMCPNVINKTRYIVACEHMSLYFEIDVFRDINNGLVIAEIELPTEDTPFIKPSWLGEEVTNDPRYYNSYLALHPFSTWN